MMFAVNQLITAVLALGVSWLTIKWFSNRQKINHSVIESRKLILDKRIEIHKEIIRLMMNARLTLIGELDGNDIRVNTFTKSYKEYEKYAVPLIVYITENKSFFSQKAYQNTLVFF